LELASYSGTFFPKGNSWAAHKKAVEVSAFVCTQSGAMPQLPLKIIAGQAKSGESAW
jgi:hypothetical protein